MMRESAPFRGALLLGLALVLPAAVLGFSSAFSPALGLKGSSTAAFLCLREPMLAPSASRLAPQQRCSHIMRRAGKEGKAEEPGEGEVAEEAEAVAAEAELMEEEEVVEEAVEEVVDPFAGLALDSKEFLQRKVEVLEKELADTAARIAEMEGDAASMQLLVAKGVLKEAKSAELVDTYFRLAADFENFRRRSEVSLVQAKDMATADIVKELLSILDNFERAAGAIKTDTDRETSINNSYQSVGKDMLKVLTKLGVEAIEPLGQEFDPNMHNAIQQVESTEYPEGVVSQGLQRGYKIGPRIVRAAMCVVSMGPGPEVAAAPEAAAAPDAEPAAAADAAEEAVETDAKTP